MRIEVPEDSAGRLDVFIAARIGQLSRSRVQVLLKSGHILVNGQRAKARQALKKGDVITIRIPPPEASGLVPQDLPLRVLFEDGHLVVLDKEPGMVVHPAAGNPDGTLVNALLHHCQGQLGGIGGVERPGIIHRLDKDTSGCLVAAKTDPALQELLRQFSERTTVKYYLALVEKAPLQKTGTVFTHIGRHPIHRQKMAVVNPGSGREAVTRYRLLHENPENGTCLVLCGLLTGRTHQIRVHLKYSGAPLLGDPIYARPERQLVQVGRGKRLGLHAWHLGLNHPATGERLYFEAPVPPEFTPWADPAADLLDEARQMIRQGLDPVIK